MTIRRTLLISYLLISLASALLITLMIFAHFRDVLRQEIEHKLESQAITLMQQIDTTLFERLKNMASWSHLDVMQEIRTRDIDKRLSQFLYELHSEYDGVYQQLFVINQENNIVASSHSNTIGYQLPSSIPWLKSSWGKHVFSFDDLGQDSNLNISIPIADAFQTTQLGRLYASFNWQEINRLVNDLASKNSVNASFYTLLIDNAGRVIASSSNLQYKVPLFQSLDKALLAEGDSGALNYYIDFLQHDALVGYARSKGYRSFKGLNWRILVLQSSDFAFAPVLKVWRVLLLFLCLTLFLGTIVSLWMSAKIAKPISLLAKSTRNFMQGNPTHLQVINASTEITELNSQFANMINNLEQSRQDVARVAKLAVIGEMAASMAHEVRTPLGVLRSSAQILQREAKLSDIGLEMTEFILSETTRLNDLVSTLLECARPREPNFSLHNIQQIIEHVRELLRSKMENQKIKLAVTSSCIDTDVYCDRDQLIQVFLNLIMNAIQHSLEQGHINIAIQCEREWVEITVCDDGLGIADKHKQAVFDPFFTQRQGGIGLGLTVVQQIVLAHHGNIFITDNKDGGTCFHLQLLKTFQGKSIHD